MYVARRELRVLLAAICVVAHVRAFNQQNTTEPFTSQQGGSNSSKMGIPLRVAVMLAFPDPETSPAITDGPSVLQAVQLAVTHINQRGDILANHSLSLVVRDDGCNVVATAARSYLDILTHAGDGRSFLAGMIGPSCSESAILVSSLNAQAETALVNLHMAASPALKGESKFPYSFGMAGSVDDYVAALTSMVSDQQWERVALIFEDNSAFYSQIATRLARDLKQQNSLSEHYSIPVRSGSIGDCITTLSMSPDPCVVFLLANSGDLARRLLCFAHSEGYRSYKWLQVEITLVDLTAEEVSFSYGRVVYSCSRADMHSFLNEALFLFVKLVPQSQNVSTVSGLTYEQYRAQYMESVTRTQGVYQAALQAASPPWANLLYDAVWALALSLNSTSDDLFSNDGDHQSLAADTQGKLKAVIDFSGVSGRIKFINNTVSRIINISQALNSIEVLIGEYDPESKMLSVGMSGLIPKCPTEDLIYRVVRVLFFTAAGIALAMTLISHTLTLFYWNQIHIKASDPRLSQYIFVGCYLCCLGIVVYTTAKTYPISLEQYGICCYVINYSVFIGFCLINSTICAKTWRLYRIFTHFDNPGPFVSNFALNAFVISSVLLMVTLLVTWSVAAPYQGRLQPDGTVKCVGKSYDIWIWVLLGYCWMLVLFSAVLSLATSKLPRSQQKLYRINSPALIGYTSSIILIISCVLVAIFRSATSYYIIISLLCCTLVFFSLVFLTLPPWLSVCRERNLAV